MNAVLLKTAARIAPVCAASLLCAAATAIAVEPPLLTPFDKPAAQAPAPWRVSKLPRQTKPVTSYSVVKLDGQSALRVDADKSYGTLIHRVTSKTRPNTLAWRWRVDQPIPNADLRQRSGDDTPVKICALYRVPRDPIPRLDRLWLDAGSKAYGIELPNATVCYVWDAQLPAGTVLNNAFTNRTRYMVLRSGTEPGWVSEQRDLDADFRQLYGSEADGARELLAIGIGGDSDNTGSHSIAHVAGLVLSR